MFYIYNDMERGGKFDPMLIGKLREMDANKQYDKHFDNYCYLRFIANHSDTSLVEKQQASREMAIAEKKMLYWKRMPLWDLNESGRLTALTKKKWQMK